MGCRLQKFSWRESVRGVTMSLKDGLKEIDILVIDDDHDVLNSFKKQLQRFESLHPVYTNNPLEGLELVSSNEWNLVLCDIKMKPITGLEVLEKIRVIKPQLPVIIITGFVDDKIMMQAKTLGCNEFLIKPVRKSVLIDAIDKVLDL
jgi:DNA-binding NtrC family response regulator